MGSCEELRCSPLAPTRIFFNAFCPSEINVADDITRDRDLRSAQPATDAHICDLLAGSLRDRVCPSACSIVNDPRIAQVLHLDTERIHLDSNSKEQVVNQVNDHLHLNSYSNDIPAWDIRHSGNLGDSELHDTLEV